MSAQLDQILSYLDKEGVTEIMIGMGQPASLRRRGQLIKITNTPVTRKQLDILLHGTHRNIQPHFGSIRQLVAHQATIAP